MAVWRWLSVWAAGALAVAGGAAGETAAPASAVSAAPAAGTAPAAPAIAETAPAPFPGREELAAELAAATAAYCETLRGALAAAERRGDAAEAGRARAALAGRPVRDFSGDYLRSARRRYDVALRAAAQKCARSARRAGKADAAAASVVKRIEEALRERAPLEVVLQECLAGAPAPAAAPAAARNAQAENAGRDVAAPSAPVAPVAAPAGGAAAAGANEPAPEYYRLRVDAAKGWQKYPLALRAGDRVTLAATGLWTPDAAAHTLANAERFPLAVRAGGDAERRCGARARFTVAAAGGLLLRMADGPEGAAAPAGAQTVTVAVERSRAEGAGDE